MSQFFHSRVVYTCPEGLTTVVHEEAVAESPPAIVILVGAVPGDELGQRRKPFTIGIELPLKAAMMSLGKLLVEMYIPVLREKSNPFVGLVKPVAVVVTST